jgi:outer membrane protein assembly factor BamB
MSIARMTWSNRVSLKRVAACFTLYILTTLAARADDWPQFRGPTGLGYAEEQNLPIVWDGNGDKNVIWAAPLIGEGHASPIVCKDRVIICTVRWPETATDRTRVIPEHHVLCYRAEDGKQLWDKVVEPGPWLRKDFRSGPGGGYAAPTPATDGRLVYCVFGSAVAAALTLDGTLVWRREIRPYTFDVTIGTSPVLFGDTVLMLCAMANKKDSKIIAWNKKDGSVAWETPLPNTGFGHSTPLLIHVNGKPQMIVLASGMAETADGLQSFDPATGRRIWWCKAAGDAASPALGAGILYCDSGRGSAGLAIDPSGTGDVSKTHVKWRVDRVPEGIGSPIIVDGHVYRLHVPNVLKCWRAADGRLIYSRRLDGLTTTWASPIADKAGRIYFASAGRSYVIQSGPDFRILAVNDLGDPNHASPAVAHGRLFLVGTRRVYCIGK